nr:U4/U6 small nuclear ribonucleoprotein Prp3-like [Penaeus vannamei]
MSLSKREYEDYKAAVEKMVYKYVTRDRSSIVSAIAHAVDSGCDKRKVEDKLMGYVDKSLAYKLAEKAFIVLEDIGPKSRVHPLASAHTKMKMIGRKTAREPGSRRRKSHPLRASSPHHHLPQLPITQSALARSRLRVG